MDAKLSKIYYSPKDYWKGLAAVKKLASTAKVEEDVAKRWLAKQALWQNISPSTTPTFLDKSLMSHCPMQCIKQTFFCLTTNYRMEKRFINML